MLANKAGKILSIRNTPGPVIIFLLIFYCLTNFTHRNWTKDEGPIRGVIKWDIISYYAYLPAFFIYHDLSLDFTENPDFVNDNKFWYQKTEKGKKVIITSMGLSYLYAPFFFTAHALAPAFGEPRDGFQSVYQFFLVFSALFYLGFGFYFLWKLLARYFPPGVSSVTLLLIGLGSNLYYYGTHEAAMSHAYNFSLIALFLYLLFRWYDDAGWRNSFLLGLVYGLIVLIRPTNFLLIILPGKFAGLFFPNRPTRSLFHFVLRRFTYFRFHGNYEIGKLFKYICNFLRQGDIIWVCLQLYYFLFIYGG